MIKWLNCLGPLLLLEKVLTMNEYPSQQINRLRKAGQLDEAWKIGVVEIQQNPNNKYLKSAFFWVCYEYLRAVQNPIMDRGKSNSNFRPMNDEYNRIGFLLDWIVSLDIPPGGFEYSRLFFLFRKNLEIFQQLVLILIKHQERLFTDEDKKPFKGGKGESPSLMLMCARKVASAWLKQGRSSAYGVDEVISLLNKARLQAHDQQQKIWLDYDEAKCLVCAERFDDARTFIIPVLKRKQNEPWAWDVLAATYFKQDPDVAIRLLSQGISCTHDEKFALRLLNNLATLLAAKGLVKEASMCTKRAVNCYQKNNWRIKGELEALHNQTWFDNNIDIGPLNSFLSNRKEGALDYLYGKRDKIAGLVINLHRSGKGCHVFLKEGISISVPLSRFKGQKPDLANYVEIEYSGPENDMNIIQGRISDYQEIDGVDMIQGELKISEKGFGFVDDTFIPPPIVRQELSGCTVEVLRYRDIDKKKNQLGWRAITIRPLIRD